MREWIDSIWQWIMENRESIMDFLTSTSFVTTITTFIALFKSIKSSKANTLSVNSVNTTMKENQIIKDDVTDVKNTVNNLKTELANTTTLVENCINRIDKLEEENKQHNEESITKLNAMLEVQTIVYGTIKDDAIRNTVNSILISAKHSDNASRIKLQEELDALRAELKSKKEELDTAVSKMMEKVSSEVTVAPTSTEKKTGKKSKNIVRY